MRKTNCAKHLVGLASLLASCIVLPLHAYGGTRAASFQRMVADADETKVTFYYPRLVTANGNGTEPDNSDYTGIAVTNLSGARATLTFTAYDTTGAAINGPDTTNPISLELDPGQQMAIVESELFGSVLPDEQRVGWIKVESNVREITGLFTMFNSTLSRLEGGAPSFTTSTSFVLSEIEEQGFTRIHIANPNGEPSSVAFHLLQHDGSYRVAPATRTIAANGVLAESVASLFPDITTADSDYIWVTSERGVVAFESVGRPAHDVSGLAGQDENAGASTLYAPQYVIGGDWRTTLSLINLDAEPGTVTLRFISDDGTQIGNTQVLSIGGYGKIYLTDQTFFLDPGDALVQGYLEITSSGVRLAGNVVFGDPAHAGFSSALPLVSTFQSEMVFSQVASNSDYFMGIALLNANDAESTATLEVFSKTGELLASRTGTIGASQRRSQLLSKYFPEFSELDINSGYVKVTSDKGLASFAVLGTRSLSALSAIPAQSVR